MASERSLTFCKKFGLCVSCNYMCAIETVYAEAAKDNAKEGLRLPLEPESSNKQGLHKLLC